MQSRSISAAIVVALVAAAVVLFVVLRDDDEDAKTATTTPAAVDEKPQKDKRTKPKPKVATIVVEGGQPAGGVTELEYSRGEVVRFDVESDVAEEVHVHGYDVSKDVEPGKAVEFSFPAEIEGGFEVELEGSHTLIAELTVEPS
ncbi:MAG TPA: hypothetical protein VK920_06215 [Solirubrobacterales bacterium]|nr:hypothetical protein [Solirubrobacterales bacterium]